MTVIENFHKGDIASLSKIISYVENRKDDYQSILKKLYTSQKRAHRIGITGPPGSGKSTIVSRLIAKFVADNKKIGIIAVDPTSPFSGGALLGDRVRVADVPENATVFFRSMATRGASGGLALAADNATVIMEAFGFDIILIETVGVGQVELDIIDSCDTVVVVLVPESGDSVQTMKAGLMEISDIMVVNKADRPGAENLVEELKYSLHLQESIDKQGWEVPIITTEATNNKNIDKLYSLILENQKFLTENNILEEKRKQQIKKKIINIINERFQLDLDKRAINSKEFEKILNSVSNGELDPFQAGDTIYKSLMGH